MSVDDDWVIVGRFGRPHGIKGFISIVSFTEPHANLLDYSAWHAKIQGQWLPLTVTQKEIKGQRIVAQIKGYDSRDDIAALTNIDIAIRREQLPDLPEGEYYHYQLVGLTVLNSAGQTLGVVTDVLPTGSNDVLVVNGERRHLIPYLPDHYVSKVSLSDQKIWVDWDVDF